MKMYILVRDDIPLGFKTVAVGHAALASYGAFNHLPQYQDWFENSFKKCICSVSAAEFEAAKQCENHLVITESALGGQEVAVVFCPRAEWPKSFRFYKLLK